ncbi:hypothetical protein DDW01_00470 [Sulfolobus sp. SCGC AB-777_G05]|nr:hypothetical protein DDW01_00470 [Sulfolobus sp. SCGC AB-777_G05]
MIFYVKLKLAYSRDEELKPLIPLINNEINNRGFEFDLIKVKEDDIKFVVNDVDLFFSPLPLFSFLKLRVITNASFVVESLWLRLKGNNSSSAFRLLVPGSNSTEYYLIKMLYPSHQQRNIVPVTKGEYDGEVSYEGGDIDIYQMWKEGCGDLPIVIKVLSTIKLKEEEIDRLKIVLRESASKAIKEFNISQYSKELGLKGRKSLECFFSLCKKKGICINVSYELF